MVCKPNFNANLPHANLATAAPQRGAQVPPRHASPTTTPTCCTKTLPPQHSAQVPPHQPIAHEPHHNATHHGTHKSLTTNPPQPHPAPHCCHCSLLIVVL